jgi:hypothetical protein
MPTDRETSPAERGASEAIAAYVSAGVLTQAEADHVLRKRLRVAERFVRANCAGTFGNAWSYGAQVRQAREEWLTSSGRIARRRKLAALAQAEVQHAVYMSTRRLSRLWRTTGRRPSWRRRSNSSTRWRRT